MSVQLGRFFSVNDRYAPGFLHFVMNEIYGFQLLHIDK